jgi:O-antigen chain-terminating methyltransferase
MSEESPSRPGCAAETAPAPVTGPVSPFDEAEAAADFVALHAGYDTRNVNLGSHGSLLAPFVGVAARAAQKILGLMLDAQVTYNAANTRVITRIKDWIGTLQRDHLGQLHAVQKQMLALEQAIAEIKAPSPLPAPGFDYRKFEDRFRGSEANLTERQRGYVPCFAGRKNILDLGCGRGEFLELLRAQGIEARGVDLNPEIVHLCREKGLDVVQADAFAHLEALPDDSLGGVFAAQVIEHLHPSRVVELVKLCHRKVEPGAPLILETPNPKCFMVFAETFYKDPSHTQPIHPDTLQFLFEAAGFREVEVRFLAPVDAAIKVPPLHATADNLEAFNQGIERLNALLFGFQDYAVIGRKEP